MHSCYIDEYRSSDRVVDRVVIGDELNRLPDEQTHGAAADVLRGSLSHSKIAATTGIPIGTVKTRTCRAWQFRASHAIGVAGVPLLLSCTAGRRERGPRPVAPTGRRL